MGIPYNDTRSHKNDTSMGNNKEVIPNADGTNVSTFKIDQPSQIDEHILDVLSRHKENLPVKVLSLLQTIGV